MKIFERAAYNLLNQFQKAEAEIRPIKDSQTKKLENETAIKIASGEDFGPYWHFSMRFNQDFSVNSANIPDKHFEYENHLSKLKNEFYRDISEDIDELPIKESLNTVTDFLTRFNECSPYYYKTERQYKTINSETTILTYQHRRIHKEFETNSENEINDILEELAINCFISVQKECLDQIISFLANKKNAIEISFEQGNSTSYKSPPGNVDNSKIEKLDRSQTALLYDYLKNVGVIKDLSSNKLAPLISELTGFSKKNLRTDGLDKIWEIKSGKIANKIESKGNPEYNLQKVKEVILEILQNVNQDIKKNKES